VVQLRQSSPVSRHIIGFDVAPHVVRALQLATQSVKGGFLLSWVRENPFVIEADRLRAVGLGPHLRPLTSGHLVLHEHIDAELLSRAIFVFIGVGTGDPNRFKRVVKAIAPSLHRLIVNVHRASESLLPELTQAEREICRLLVEGASNKEIARALNKSEATVRNQLHAVFAKLAVRTRTAAAIKLRTLYPTIVAVDQQRKVTALEYLYY
jgi:DNA-binding CsgD family transcriptional regulator